MKRNILYVRVDVILAIETRLIFDRNICHRVFLFFFRRMNHVCNLPRISATKNRPRAKDGRVGHSTCGPSNWSKNHRPARCNKIYRRHHCQNISAIFHKISLETIVPFCAWHYFLPSERNVARDLMTDVSFKHFRMSRRRITRNSKLLKNNI